jgi:hypothetical protein
MWSWPVRGGGGSKVKANDTDAEASAATVALRVGSPRPGLSRGCQARTS